MVYEMVSSSYPIVPHYYLMIFPSVSHGVAIIAIISQINPHVVSCIPSISVNICLA